MGKARALIALRKQLPVAAERGGACFRGGFDSQYQQRLAPSIVIFRALSEHFSMLTRISEPSNASGTFSLHSTAHTPPRSR